MELFGLGIIYLMLAPIFIGWMMVLMGPIVLPIASLFYLLTLGQRSSERASDAMEPSYVLVVDDEFQSVLPLIRLLERAKVPFKYVQNGVEAINEMSKRHFRLVFMDFYMPKLTGVETLLKADPLIENNAPPTPVIFYSGRDVKPSSRLKLRHLLVVDTWNKSMNLQSLWYRLDNLLVSTPS